MNLQGYQDCNQTHWQNTLVGYFIGSRPPYHIVKARAEALWKPTGGMEILTLPAGFYIFHFALAEDRNRILEGGPKQASPPQTLGPKHQIAKDKLISHPGMDQNPRPPDVSLDANLNQPDCQRRRSATIYGPGHSNKVPNQLCQNLRRDICRSATSWPDQILGEWRSRLHTAAGI